MFWRGMTSLSCVVDKGWHVGHIVQDRRVGKVCHAVPACLTERRQWLWHLVWPRGPLWAAWCRRGAAVVPLWCRCGAAGLSEEPAAIAGWRPHDKSARTPHSENANKSFTERRCAAREAARPTDTAIGGSVCAAFKRKTDINHSNNIKLFQLNWQVRSCKDIKAWIIGHSERPTITFAEKTRILCKAVLLEAAEWMHFSSLMIVCRLGAGRCRAHIAGSADTHGWSNGRQSAARHSRQPGHSEGSFMWCQVWCKSCTRPSAVRRQSSSDRRGVGRWWVESRLSGLMEGYR